MSYDVYWVKNRAEKITDFEHPTCKGNSKRTISLCFHVTMLKK